MPLEQRLPSRSNSPLAKLYCIDDDRPFAISRPRGGRVYSPAEVALVQLDEVVSLLVALGATVDVSINPPYVDNMTLLQWTSAMLAKLETLSGPRRISEPLQEPSTDTWAQYKAYFAAVLSTREDTGSSVFQLFFAAPKTAISHLDEEHVSATRDYYARAESILHSHSAIPLQLPQSSEAPIPPALTQQHDSSNGARYVLDTKYSTVSIPAHLKVLYDELYEACWTGDNKTIQELCLPKHLAEGKEPIQISVQACTNSYESEDGVLWSIFSVEAE